MPAPLYFTLPTVKVHSDATESGYVIINATDFDEAEHLLFEEAPEPAPAA